MKYFSPFVVLTLAGCGQGDPAATAKKPGCAEAVQYAYAAGQCEMDVSEIPFELSQNCVAAPALRQAWDDLKERHEGDSCLDDTVLTRIYSGDAAYYKAVATKRLSTILEVDKYSDPKHVVALHAASGKPFQNRREREEPIYHK